MHQPTGRVVLEDLSLAQMDVVLGHVHADGEPTFQSEFTAAPKLYLARTFGSVIASHNSSGVVLMKISYTFSICLSNLSLISLNPATQGSANLWTQRSWMSRIGTGLRKWSFSRPRRLVTTSPASSSTFRCFMTPKRDMENRSSNVPRVCPSSRDSSSRRLRRVGSARALNTSSTPRLYVTKWSRVKTGLRPAAASNRRAARGGPRTSPTPPRSP